MSNIPLSLHVGISLQLRKPHACGSDEWIVTRIGADIGLQCRGCGRRILIEREELIHSIRHKVEKPPS